MSETQQAQTLTARQRHPNRTTALETKTNQSLFLKHYSECGEVKAAAIKTGVEPPTVFIWAKQSEAFAKRFEEARILGEKALVSDCISHVKTRAFAGKEDPGSTNLLMFLTKRYDPAFRDNAVVNVNAVGPVAMQFNLNTTQTQAIDKPEE